MANEDLDTTVKRLLTSETFEVAELGEVLVQRGYDKDEVDAAIARAATQIDDQQRSPRYQSAVAHGRRGKRLLQLGMMWLVIGLGFAIYGGGGILQLLLVIVPGAGLIVAGRRSLALAKHELPVRLERRPPR